MPAPWSAKGAKISPLVAHDQFMILDSQDATLSTKNKRVTLATVQTDLVINVDANGFGISDFSFLISRNSIVTPGTVVADIPISLGNGDGIGWDNFAEDGDQIVITGNTSDEFQISIAGTNEYLFGASAANWAANNLINVGQVAIGQAAVTSGKQVAITIPDDTVNEGIVIQNTDGGFTFTNATGTTDEFAAQVNVTTAGSTNSFNTTATTPVAGDTGGLAITEYVSRREPTADIVTRPVFEWFNNATTVMKIEADGTFEVALPTGSIFVGDENNLSGSYSAELETKEECLAATTANITLANSQTIDTVAVVNPNRVLVKDQTLITTAIRISNKATNINNWKYALHECLDLLDFLTKP